jgi:HD-GYP domain-containing protein (c-di-GMP phosphodiesterase class II)
MAQGSHRLQQIQVEKSGLGGRLHKLHRIVGARFPAIGRIALAVYDVDSDLLKTFVSSNDDDRALTRYEARLADVPSLLALHLTRQSRVVDDLHTAFHTPSTHTTWLKEHGYRSSYTLPIHHGEALLGFMFFDANEPAAFTPEVTAFLDVFGDIIAQLYLLRVAAVNTLVGAVDVATGLARIRDVETGRHLERMAAYARLIARRLAPTADLSDEFVEYLFLFAPLHDIGKVGIPDRILLKPGRLDGEEWAVMQTHVNIGVDLVDHIVSDLGLSDDPAAQVMRDVVGGHHERGDGSGYPLGLRLPEIPMAARIVAVADVYDALSTKRPYKAAWPEDECLAQLRQEALALRLDAACVEALAGADQERAEIRERLADGD